MRRFSTSLKGLWSSDISSVPLFRTSTHRLSPQFATMMCVGVTRAAMAVLPL
jgi:hypothetical protein